MNIRKIAALLCVGLSASVALAQSSTPPTPPLPTPPLAPTSPEPPAAPQPNVVEGTLMRTQRANNDRGKYEWICTYRVAGTTRIVQVDESCPQTMPFALKK